LLAALTKHEKQLGLLHFTKARQPATEKKAAASGKRKPRKPKSSRLRPSCSAALFTPSLKAAQRAPEVFTAPINNDNTRKTYLKCDAATRRMV
jgi:hypothetical protein